MTVNVFLALIRCATEPLRLQYYANHPLALSEVIQFLWGAIITSAGLLSATITSFYNHPKTVSAICAFTILALFVLKWVFTTQ